MNKRVTGHQGWSGSKDGAGTKSMRVQVGFGSVSEVKKRSCRGMSGKEIGTKGKRLKDMDLEAALEKCESGGRLKVAGCRLVKMELERICKEIENTALLEEDQSIAARLSSINQFGVKNKPRTNEGWKLFDEIKRVNKEIASSETVHPCYRGVAHERIESFEINYNPDIEGLARVERAIKAPIGGGMSHSQREKRIHDVEDKVIGFGDEKDGSVINSMIEELEAVYADSMEYILEQGRACKIDLAYDVSSALLCMCDRFRDVEGVLECFKGFANKYYAEQVRLCDRFGGSGIPAYSRQIIVNEEIDVEAIEKESRITAGEWQLVSGLCRGLLEGVDHSQGEIKVDFGSDVLSEFKKVNK